MLHFIALLVLMACIQPSQATGESLNNNLQRRSYTTLVDGTYDDDDTSSSNQIIGGVPTNGQEIPFYVQPDSSMTSAYCGATLIARDMVLTAATCAGAFNSTKVLVGAYKRDSTDGPAQWRNIQSDFMVHPNYDATSKKYDFMIFQIEQVTLSNIYPVTLNTNLTTPSEGQSIAAIGMGQTLASNTSSISDVLRKVAVQVVSQLDCQTAYKDVVTIDETSMICGSSTSNKDSCGGDSGGPLLNQNKVLVGLASFGGTICANGTFPSVYARVAGAMDWIQAQVCSLSSTPPSYCPENLTNSTSTKVPTMSPTTTNTSHTNATHPTKAPSSHINSPTKRPTSNRPPTNHDNNSYTWYRVEIKYDNNPRLFAWKIRDITDHSIVLWYPMNVVFTPYRKLTRNIKLKHNHQYRLVLRSRNGQGLKKGGYVKLYQGNRMIQRIQGHDIGWWHKTEFYVN